ncbi:glycoside hydrolase family 2 TIM barrel-domain containing protein [Tessaracoccus sp. OH4464_COT-324]|uniref:glycoside hydrolase family 2 TIM barrel-domain containing protein n=1 Tax=Tessaracoccus sp. OH4464_COT-324 TaxID=2491059 RepID=UPI000F633194|nr:glycoside hydrolase family 2 TIM barrel-domain containing protein [Tessaracoccus sp. OH4464_COT-324]RRD45198.1 DUF4981 domain-containing protein [Tessaracoccus sp. OH4464_COT-324]
MTLTERTLAALDATTPGDGVPARSWRAEPQILDLSGPWRFHYSPGVRVAPEACHVENYDDSTWDTLAVPGHWVLAPGHPYGKPHYTNIQLPIPMDPPHTPDDNGIGDYRRDFELPEAWRGQQILLRFDGVESIGIVHVNGREVGVVRGSRLTTELDITDVVRAGHNALHVRVAQFSAQTYVEDQDQWWLPGIFRAVAIVARPAGGINDFCITADFDHRSGTGRLAVEAQASFPLTLAVPELDVNVTWDSPDDVQPVPVGPVEPWSPDSPRLYAATLSNSHETAHTRVGFRTVRIVGNQWLINGTKVRIRGVNRHEYHPELGRVFDEDSARAGLIEMKRANINAIRTAHYPPHPRLFDLTDELGFWVMAECDLETHAFLDYDWEHNPTDDPAWRAALVQRMRRMVLRDRNHPSIICWSLGNESGTGANLAAMAEEAHRLDPTRPVHYENDYEAAYTDLVSRMYPPPAEMAAMSAGTADAYAPHPAAAARFSDKPKILCEFAHAMGNGAGAVGEYVTLFETLADWHGGFVWEWRDHGLATTTDDGVPFHAYGGDFGELNHDGNFVLDGLLTSDGVPSPMLAEVAQQFSPVVVTLAEGSLVVENRFHASGTDHLRFRWRWEVAGELRADGELPVAVAANSSAELPLPELPGSATVERDSFLTIFVEERADRPWATAGHRVYVAQFRLDRCPPPVLPRPTAAPLVRGHVHVGPAQLCPHTGRLLALGDIAVAEAGVELWRAPTDNDAAGHFGSFELANYFATNGFGAPGPSSAERWRAQGLDRLLARTTLIELAGDDFVVVQRLMAAQSRHGAEVTYRWRRVGDAAACKLLVAPIRLRTDVTWPRIGFHLLLPGGFDEARWFGGGPGESYPDSRAASIVAEHESLVDDLTFRYAMPQETGHREQLRRLVLSGEAGRLAWRTFGPDLPGFTLGRHDAHELTRATHQHELPPSRGTHLYLDAAVHGLGSRACGPDVLPQHALWPRAAEFGFLVEVG